MFFHTFVVNLLMRGNYTAVHRKCEGRLLAESFEVCLWITVFRVQKRVQLVINWAGHEAYATFIAEISSQRKCEQSNSPNFTSDSPPRVGPPETDYGLRHHDQPPVK